MMVVVVGWPWYEGARRGTLPPLGAVPQRPRLELKMAELVGRGRRRLMLAASQENPKTKTQGRGEEDTSLRCVNGCP